MSTNVSSSKSRSRCIFFATVVYLFYIVAVLVIMIVSITTDILSIVGGPVTVGGNASVLLNSFDNVQAVRITSSIENSTISVHTISCDALNTQELSLPVKMQSVTSSQDHIHVCTRVPLNYYGGEVPLYTIDSGSVTIIVNVSTESYQPDLFCLVKIVVFTDLVTYESFLSSPTSSSYDASSEFCTYMYQSFPESDIIHVPLNSTGFYFFAAVVHNGTSAEITMSADLTVYSTTAFLDQSSGTDHDCSFSSQQTSCSIDTSAYRGTFCIFVQSEHYQTLQYSYTNTLALLLVLFALVLMIVSAPPVLLLQLYLICKHTSCACTCTCCNVTTSYVQHADSQQIDEEFAIQNTNLVTSGARKGSIETISLAEIETTTCTYESFISTATGTVTYDIQSDVDTLQHSNDVESDDTLLHSDDVQSRNLDQPKISGCDIIFLLNNIRNIFGAPKELTVDSSGLIHHCSQYGVTLIIPEGAVQQSATVWFGACLFSDWFQFEDDYVPVSPIVWVYIDQVLLMPAELYIPHHIDLSDMNDSQIVEQLFLLTAADDTTSLMMGFQNNSEFHLEIESDCQVAKIISTHFCSNCIATHKRQYKSIPKRYLIARADKKEGNDKILVEFILSYSQQGCIKMVEGQCVKNSYTIICRDPVTFTEDGRVSFSIDPSAVNGWIRSSGLCYDYISEKSIDYYELMGCEGGEVTQDNLDRLESLEEISSYPPRFRIQFELDSTADHFKMCSQTVNVQFHGIEPSLKSTIVLGKPGDSDIPLSPTPSDSHSATDDIGMLSEATNPGLSDVLRIIATSDQLKDNWFYFGCKMNIKIEQLQKIETTCSGNEQCTRMIILHWRANSKTTSWEPIAVALDEFGLSELAHKIRDCLSSKLKEPKWPNNEGVYCSLCDTYHMKPEDMYTSSTVSPTITRSANFQEYKPDIAYSALIANTSRITESKIGLDYFATKLLEVRIITEAEKIEATNDMMSGRTESQRMDTLLDSLVATVKVDGCYFQWFIQILRDKNTVLTKSLADTLIADYNRRDHSNLYVESI